MPTLSCFACSVPIRWLSGSFAAHITLYDDLFVDIFSWLFFIPERQQCTSTA